MAAGSIVKGQLLVVEKLTVKLNEDIEKGEIVYNDGNGVLAAPNTATGPFYMALEAHTYASSTTHEVECVLSGCVEAQKAAGTAVKKGQQVYVSATAGELTLFVKGDAPATYVEADAQTALDANLRRVGVCSSDAASGDTTVKVWMGVPA